MQYFKITMPKDPDMLPLFASIDDDLLSFSKASATAVKKIERLLGPLKDPKVTKIMKSEIPEDETIF